MHEHHMLFEVFFADKQADAAAAVILGEARANHHIRQTLLESEF